MQQGKECVVSSPHLCGLQSSGDAPDVGQAVLTVVPAAVRQVNASHERHGLVNDHNLLMVSPQVHRGGDVVWVPHHLHALTC